MARIVGCDAKALAQTFADVAAAVRGEKRMSSAATSRRNPCQAAVPRLEDYPGQHAAKLANVKRLVDEISARPAAQKAVALKDRYAFKTEMDEEAKRAMFPGNYRAQAGA